MSGRPSPPVKPHLLALIRGFLCVIAFGSTDLLAGGITGNVTGPDGVTPLPGVVVFATSQPFNGNSGSSVTGLDGSYAINGLGASNYDVYFSVSPPSPFLPEFFDGASNYANLTLVTVAAGGTISGINASLALGGIISGTVFRVNQPLPAAGATVEIFEAYGPGQWFPTQTTTTEADGTYSVVGLRPGEYRLRFSATDLAFEFYNNAVTVETASDVVVTGSEVISGIDATLELPATISGVVTGPDGTTPVSGGYVEAFALVGSNWVPALSVATGVDGTYTLDGMPAGSYGLLFSGPYESPLLAEWYDDAPDFSSADTQVLTAGMALNGINASLALGGSISGVVTESAGGNPVSYAYVTAHDAAGFLVSSTFTGFDGTYSMLRMRTGNYRVTFSHPSYANEYYDDVVFASAADAVAVTVGFDSPGINAVLGPAASIFGAVTAEDGVTPLFGIAVEALLFNGSTWEVVNSASSSSTDGTYQIGQLPEGNFVVRFSASGFQTVFFDGVTNAAAATPVVLSSYGAATNINASLSAIQPTWVAVEDLTRTGAGTFALDFAGTANKWFQLQMSGSLLSWTNTGAPVQAVPLFGNTGTNSISISTSASKEFWRLIEAAP